MNLPLLFHANFFTLGALIPVCFFLFCAVYFLTIKKKSRATYCYGMGTLFVCGFNLAYFLASGVYHPVAALHRWLTVGTILMSELYFIKFIYFIDREEASRPVRVLFAALFVVAIAVPAVFIAFTYDAPRVFRFDGHYYDLDADYISRLIGYFIQLYMIIFIVTTAIKIFTAEKVRRLTIFALGAAFVLAALVPSVINVMSRDGRIDRETFQVAWDVLNISGFFLMTIVFINYTTDRISFMAKVIGISLTALLVLFQGIVFLSISDREKAFDGIMYGQTRLAVDHATSIPDFTYLASMPEDDESGKLLTISSRVIDGDAYSPYRCQLITMGILERIRRLPDEGFDRGLSEILGTAPPYFSGYAQALTALRHGRSRSTDIGMGLVDDVAGLRNVLRYHDGKIRKIPDEGFRKGLRLFLSGAGEAFSPFARALEGFLAKTTLEDGALKQEVLTFLTPPVLSGGRCFRTIGGRNFVSFLHYEAPTKTVHEAGFPYLTYREYFHSYCMKFIYLLCATFVIIFICFSLYFRGSMVKPIERLLKGLDSIKNGDLDIRIPAKAQDEIGMLAEDFNQMARVMKRNRDQLDEYMRTLEERVRERTLELEEKNKTLRAAHEDLRESEEKYRMIVNNMSDAIWVLSLKDLNFTYMSPSFFKITGYDEKEFSTLTLRSILSPASYELSKAVITRSLKDDDASSRILELEHMHRDGHIVYTEVTAGGIRGEDGAIVSIMGVTRDITQRKKAEEALRESEEKYRTILDSGKFAFFEVDLKGDFVFVNRPFLEQSGFAEEDLVGKSFRNVVNKEDWDKVFREYARIYAGELAEAEMYNEFVCKDGSSKFADVIVYPVLNHNKNVVGFKGIAQDVTERKNAEEALRASEERYRNIVQNATDGIFRNDVMGNFIFVNPVGQELLGYSEEELLKINYRDLVVPEHRARVFNDYRVQLQNKTKESYLEFPVVRKDGQVIWLGQRVRLERNGAIWEFHGISRDITARVKAEEELKVAKEAAERANKAKSRFLANMSHELRTPLNSINGIVELLRFGSYEKNEEIVIELEKAVDELRKNVKGKQAAELAESLSSVMNFLQDDGNLKRYYFLKTVGLVEGLKTAGTVEAILNDIMQKVDEEDRDIFNAYRRIKESGDYLLSLIDTILNLSKIESGKIDIKKTDVDVRGMVASVIDNAKSFARSKGKGGLAISYLVHEKVPQKAPMDHQKTKQVLLNLFSNAIKFTDEGSVTLLVNRTDDAIRFTVIDTGAGIREEEREKVFLEFERTSSSRNVEGTGLGLAITKRLVELQEGIVGFESEHNGGSRFWFTLPLRSE